MIGRAGLYLTPEQIAAGYTIPTTAPEGDGTAHKALIPGHTPGRGFGLTRWLVIGLGALLLWQMLKK